MAVKSDYVALIKELLPPGPAWPRDDTESTYAIVIDEIADVCASLDIQAGQLVEESDPLTCVQSFEDWEYDWGLPDECVEAFSSDPQTMAQRRAILLLTTRMIHGQSREFFVWLANFLGREATVEELRDGVDPDLNFVWRVTFRDTGDYEDWGMLIDVSPGDEVEDWDLLSNVTTPLVSDWDMGAIAVGDVAAYDQATVQMQVTDPLASWGDALVECVINRYRPAHTTVRFAYT